VLRFPRLRAIENPVHIQKDDLHIVYDTRFLEFVKKNSCFVSRISVFPNMENTKQCKGCSSTFPKSILIDGKRINLTSRRYCLMCSPLGGGNRCQWSKHQVIDGVDNRKCPACDTFKPLSEFYLYKERPSGACKQCDSQERKSRHDQTKQRAIDYKGGKCMDCSGTFPNCVYDFHHIDPHTKEFNVGSKRWAVWSKLTIELDKCVLLCSNCHRIRHSK
jgi:hypothetical protein